MSRIGRLPIAIPENITVEIENRIVTVKGAKGSLSQEICNPHITVVVEGKEVKVTRNNEEKETKAAHGLYRALIHNMVEGVNKGYEKSLIIAGVGYKAQAVKDSKSIVLSLGYSHTITVDPPQGITLECPTLTEIKVSGIDKVAVGQCAANIKALRKPEPFHGYGIRYKTETIMRKEPKKSTK